MAIRDHIDRAGNHWQIWLVVPTGRTAPAVTEERRGRTQPTYTGTDRRRKVFTLTPGMEDGWLCFDSPGEKRRLAPVPADWERSSPETMEGYLEQARAVSRRIVEQPPSADREQTIDAH